MITSPPTIWTRYFDGLSDDLGQLPVEADDYVRRLTHTIPLNSSMRVLDFGCGPGFVAAQLAERVGAIALWDASMPMRQMALARAGIAGNASILDFASPLPERFDLILVNSVVQYMSVDQLLEAMRLWRRLLRADGCVVLSDVIPPHSTMMAELRDTVFLATRSGVLMRTPLRLYREFQRYAAVRRNAPLLSLSRDAIEQLARQASLTATTLASNLTFRRSRTSYLLRPAVVPADE